MDVQSENIVALCDVGDENAKRAFNKFPQAKRVGDFRRMFDQEKSIDAVVVSTPDHTHPIAAITAMCCGLPVYGEKRLVVATWTNRGQNRYQRSILTSLNL